MALVGSLLGGAIGYGARHFLDEKCDEEESLKKGKEEGRQEGRVEMAKEVLIPMLCASISSAEQCNSVDICTYSLGETDLCIPSTSHKFAEDAAQATNDVCSLFSPTLCPTRRVEVIPGCCADGICTASSEETFDGVCMLLNNKCVMRAIDED